MPARQSWHGGPASSGRRLAQVPIPTRRYGCRTRGQRHAASRSSSGFSIITASVAKASSVDLLRHEDPLAKKHRGQTCLPNASPWAPQGHIASRASSKLYPPEPNIKNEVVTASCAVDSKDAGTEQKTMQRCDQTKRCICVYVSCVIHITDKHHPRYVHLNPSVCYPTAILSLFSLRLNTDSLAHG